MLKKITKWLPIFLVSFIFLVLGAYGNITGSENSVALFTELNLYNLGEHFGRYFVGILQIIVAITIWPKQTRVIAAFAGSVIMVVALWVHAIIIGLDTAVPAFITLGLSLWVLLRQKSK